MQSQIKQPIVAKINKRPVVIIDKQGNESKFLYEFEMYHAFLLYEVPAIRFRGILRGGHVEIETYGLIARKVWYEGTERKTSDDIDFGPLSAQQYEVNGILQLLCRFIIPSIDLRITEPSESTPMPSDFIRHVVSNEKALLNRNDWGNPFGKVAENLLKKQLRIELNISIPPLKALVELNQKRRNNRLRLSRMYHAKRSKEKETDV